MLWQATYGGRGGAGNAWEHVIEPGIFSRVIDYEIGRAQALRDVRDRQKAEAETKKLAKKALKESELTRRNSDSRRSAFSLRKSSLLLFKGLKLTLIVGSIIPNRGHTASFEYGPLGSV